MDEHMWVTGPRCTSHHGGMSSWARLQLEVVCSDLSTDKFSELNLNGCVPQPCMSTAPV